MIFFPSTKSCSFHSVVSTKGPVNSVLKATNAFSWKKVLRPWTHNSQAPMGVFRLCSMGLSTTSLNPTIQYNWTRYFGSIPLNPYLKIPAITFPYPGIRPYKIEYINHVSWTYTPPPPKKSLEISVTDCPQQSPHIVFFDHRPYFTDAEISQTGSEKVHKFFGSTYPRCRGTRAL